MQSVTFELFQAAFQWCSLAAIVGGVAFRYWQCNGEDARRRGPRHTQRPATVDEPQAQNDMAWLSLSAPADGGTTGRQGLRSRELAGKHTAKSGRRLI